MAEPMMNREKADTVEGSQTNSLPHWDETIASQLASSDELVLEQAHYEVLYYLRRCYERFGIIRCARSLTQALETRFAILGGKNYLYTLFPNGPIDQGCRLAGLPIPGDCHDMSFGSAS